MGQEISKSHFSAGEFAAFADKLHDNLEALSRVMALPDFGRSRPRLGAELELYIVDGACNPLCINEALSRAMDDPSLSLELNRYNLECNLDVRDLTGSPFSALEQEIVARLRRLGAAASTFGARMVMIGILPTLKEADLGDAVMTPEMRYQALSEVLLELRGRDIAINIRGRDNLQLHRQDVTLEGACTSLQIHYSFPIEEFVATWNAATLVTPLVLGCGANSPVLLGKRLWHETRVPLFKQSTDGRRHEPAWHDLPRVELGYDWLRHSAHELFAQRVYLYPPLIPLCHSEAPLESLAKGLIPQLHELNLHNGTVWHWNRPIYSHCDGGQIRIELRSLPAGPSAADMAANAAFHLGLAVALRDEIDAMLPAIPFRFVSENFYRAAREGIDAHLIWPSPRQNRLSDRPLRDIGLELSERAIGGLIQLGVTPDEARHHIGIIQGRLANGQNGARWQLDSLRRLAGDHITIDALRELVFCYMENSDQNRPVSQWEQPA